MLVGNTEEIFNKSGQHSYEDIHLPARAASVTHRIVFRNMARPEIAEDRLELTRALLEAPCGRVNTLATVSLIFFAHNMRGHLIPEDPIY